MATEPSSSRSRTLADDQARLEVDLYLKAWQAAHPDVEAHLLGIPQSRVENDAGEAD